MNGLLLLSLLLCIGLLFYSDKKYDLLQRHSKGLELKIQELKAKSEILRSLQSKELSRYKSLMTEKIQSEVRISELEVEVKKESNFSDKLMTSLTKQGRKHKFYVEEATAKHDALIVERDKLERRLADSSEKYENCKRKIEDLIRFYNFYTGMIAQQLTYDNFAGDAREARLRHEEQDAKQSFVPSDEHLKLTARERKTLWPIKKERKGIFAYYYLFHYYSKNRFPEVGNKDDAARQLLWSFKNGNTEYSEIFSNEVSSHLLNLFESGELVFRPSDIIAIIPASTRTKNHHRFSIFCKSISDQTSLINGFESIKIDVDRDALKGSFGVDKISNLEFNRDMIEGNTIYLIDDVITTGASFLQVSEKLKENGARDIVGIFLGKTFYERKRFMATNRSTRSS